MDIKKAKEKLDAVIQKSRVHLYKPIQIAEILYRDRIEQDIDLLKLETYRILSKQWRDVICIQFLGRISTSSAKFQDNLFEANAIPPEILSLLGEENKKNNGVVEAYIYKLFEDKHSQLNNALTYCTNSSKEDFDLRYFLDQFWYQAGLKRSLDKIFEIVVYALFEILITAANVKIDIYYNPDKKSLLNEFSAFTRKVLDLDIEKNRQTLDAHFYRVGVTNAADRGLDMLANFGFVI